MTASPSTTMTTTATTSAVETYAATFNGAQKRIRSPHHNDVLSGRGGGINSHAGNRAFREWVHARKEEYNLCGSKAEKAKIAHQVIKLVQSQNPPGRFLQRGTNSVVGPTWWIELDESKALAKTSQALREGAPKIRAEHQDELLERGIPVGRRKRKTTSDREPDSSKRHRSLEERDAIPAQQTPLPTAIVGSALTRNIFPQQTTWQQPQQPIPVPAPVVEEFPTLPLVQQTSAVVVENSPPMIPLADPVHEIPPISPMKPYWDPALIVDDGKRKTNFGLTRMHSLVLSDIGGDAIENEDFVNPFDDESDILYAFNYNTF